jgi:anthranilate phosphoribosyltransferase
MDASELAGARPEENARIIQEVLSGDGARAARAAVALNAAAGFYVAGRVDALDEGLALAESVLDEKTGLDVLEKLRQATTPAK